MTCGRESRRRVLEALCTVGVAGLAGCAGVGGDAGTPTSAGEPTGPRTRSPTATPAPTRTSPAGDAGSPTDGGAATPVDADTESPTPREPPGSTPAPEASTATPTATEREYANSRDAPESVTVWNPEDGPAVRSSDRSPEENLFESSPAWRYEHWLVTTADERDALEFSGGTTGVGTARAFVAATDLSERNLLIHQYDTAPCETRELAELKWGDDSCGDAACLGISLVYDPVELDGECGGDESGGADGPPYENGVSEVTFVRVPADVESYGAFSVRV